MSVEGKTNFVISVINFIADHINVIMTDKKVIPLGMNSVPCVDLYTHITQDIHVKIKFLMIQMVSNYLY